MFKRLLGVLSLLALLGTVGADAAVYRRDVYFRDTEPSGACSEDATLLFYAQDTRKFGQCISNLWDFPTPGGGAGSDTTAIHEDTAGEINAVTLKASPVSADVVLIEDSVASWAKKRTTVGALTSAGDEKVKVSSNDTTADYFEAKFVVAHGSNSVDPLELSTLNDGADEDRQLQFDEAKVDHDALNNFVGGEHFLQSAITTTGVVVTGTWKVDIDQSTSGVFDMDQTDPTTNEGRLAWNATDNRIWGGETGGSVEFYSGAHFATTDEANDLEAQDPANILSNEFYLGNGAASGVFTDFDTEVSANTDVDANTTARHARSHAVTGASDHTATNWRVFYSGAGSIVELALGADGTYLRSNGASSAPTFTTPPQGDVTAWGNCAGGDCADGSGAAAGTQFTLYSASGNCTFDNDTGIFTSTCPISVDAHATDGGEMALKEGVDKGVNTFKISVPLAGLTGDQDCEVTAGGLIPADCLSATDLDTDGTVKWENATDLDTDGTVKWENQVGERQRSRRGWRRGGRLARTHHLLAARRRRPHRRSHRRQPRAGVHGGRRSLRLLGVQRDRRWNLLPRHR
jgi:hypothetical protein